MKKNNKIILGVIITLLLFVGLYYLLKGQDVNNFINITDKKDEKMTVEVAKNIGGDCINKAISFYEVIPGNTSGHKKIDKDNYLEIEPFMNKAKNIFNEKEIDDFIGYYDILYKDKKYYIKETNNKLVYIYDNVKLKPKNIQDNKIEFKVTWEYCDAVKSSELSECKDTESLQYKNNFTIELIKNNWIITEFSLPE